MYFKDGDLKIPLTLNSIFSYFSATKPTAQTLNNYEDTYFLTPYRCNLYDNAYQQNKEYILNLKGELTCPKHRQRIILNDIHNNDNIADASFIGDVETSAITSLLDKQTKGEVKPLFDVAPSDADEIASVLANVNPIFDDRILYRRLSDRTNLVKSR